MKLDEAQKVAEEVLRASPLGKHVVKVEVTEFTHVDDSEMFDIKAILDDDAPFDTGWDFAKAQLALVDGFKSRGDDRFPLLSTKRPRSLKPEEISLILRKLRS